jgi:hypothetical protein
MNSLSRLLFDVNQNYTEGRAIASKRSRKGLRMAYPCKHFAKLPKLRNVVSEKVKISPGYFRKNDGFWGWGQPLTEPAANPVTMLRWTKTVRRREGSVTISAAAAKGPQESCS